MALHFTTFTCHFMTRRVDLIRKVRATLGTVEAPDEKTAIAKAVEQFNIRPALRNKIAVTKIDTKGG
jgi:hypothetical protein